MGKYNSAQPNTRLCPPRHSDRFYILKLLRETMESIAADSYLPKREGLVLVDLGCGSMPYRPIFERYVSEYIGVDLPGNHAANSHADLNEITGLSDGFADIVLSTQVLEHVQQPIIYLRQSYRLLNPNGLLILSTHGYWIYHPDPRDLWRWTADGLRSAVEEVGFRIVDFRGLMGLAPTAIQLLQDSYVRRVPNFVRPLFSLSMQTVAMLLDKLHSPAERARDACVYVVVARKTEELPSGSKS
jgi:SAM-dependent methyltransferase